MATVAPPPDVTINSGTTNQALAALGLGGSNQITSGQPAAKVVTVNQTPAGTGAVITPNTPVVTPAATPTTGTLSPAAITAALAAMANQQQTEQNQFNSASTVNAANDQQQQLNETTQEQNNTGARADAIQNAEQAAASGNQGLKQVLASLGALGGTGQILAGRAVANSANDDIGNADTTYKTNDQAIQSAIDAYQSQVNARNATLGTALATDKQNTSNSTYQNLIDQAESLGDTASVNKFLPDLVGSTAPITSITPATVLYNGANVGAYNPTSSVNVTAAPSIPGTTASTTAAENAVTPVNSALYVNKTT